MNNNFLYGLGFIVAVILAALTAMENVIPLATAFLVIAIFLLAVLTLNYLNAPYEG